MNDVVDRLNDKIRRLITRLNRLRNQRDEARARVVVLESRLAVLGYEIPCHD